MKPINVVRSLAPLAGVVLLPAAPATAAPSVKVKVTSPCYVDTCTATLTVTPTAPTRLQASFNHTGGQSAFVATQSAVCAPATAKDWIYADTICRVESRLPRRTGSVTIAWQLTSGSEAVVFRTRRIQVRPRPNRRQPSSRRPTAKAPSKTHWSVLCRQAKAGDKCQPGGNRKVAGGGEKVSHKGWPSITGVFWQVEAFRAGRKFTGGPKNDELLGHHGSDRINGKGGKDVIWGDWDPRNNNTWQKDVLTGGPGNDWIYSSHGRNRISGGPGRDYIWAYYGRGTIDCGAGKSDTVRVRLVNRYTIRNCERLKNFCGHGSKPGGGCYKPGEKPASRPRVLIPAAGSRIAFP